MTEEIEYIRAELDRLIHRRGDLATMRDDKKNELDAIDREETATVGAIQAARIRLINLEAEQRNSPAAKIVPLEADAKPAKK